MANINWLKINANRKSTLVGRRKLNIKAKPFLKWAGGKRQLLNIISSHYPSELGKRINKYAEPFVGGGAVLFDILNKYTVKDIYISDTNAELINTYIILRDNVKELIDVLKEYQSVYLPKEKNNRKIYYYKCRSRFNELKGKISKSVELAALFLFLNKTCFNGLYRVNSKGEYNVPAGEYKTPVICDEENLKNVSEKLQGVIIECADYRHSVEFIDERTFAYFDPPYRPLNATSSFKSYTDQGFNDKDQEELARFIKMLNAKGAYILASNADPKNTDICDDFFEKIYADMKIKRVYAVRMINSKADLRGKISELLITGKEAADL